MAGQVGFDEGSLFNTLSKPKHTIEKYKYNKDGTVKQKTTTVASYWDAVMAVGGPALIFAIVAIINRLATTIPDWFDDKETKWIKDHPMLFIAMGPIAFKLFMKKAEVIGTLPDVAEMLSPVAWALQVKQNWGFGGGPATMTEGESFKTLLGERSRTIDPETGRVTVKLGWGV